MVTVGVKRSLGVVAFVFLFSQMNLPEKVVNRSTYDYVVNLSKFSFAKLESIDDEGVDRLISAYKLVYFDKKKVVKRVRDLKGRRVYKRIEVLVPRKTPRLGALQFVKNQYYSFPPSPYKPDFCLLYGDLLCASGKYSSALEVFWSLSNTSVYDEVLLRIAGIGIRTGNIRIAKDSLSLYESMKGGSIYSPIYLLYKAMILAREKNLESSLRIVRDLVVFDLTLKYDYVQNIIEYFEYLAGLGCFDNIGVEERKVLREICFELLDYKLYDEAVRVASLSKLGVGFISELILDMKLLGVKGWKALARNYLYGIHRDIVFNPVRFEKNLDILEKHLKSSVLKSLIVHYTKHNLQKAVFYISEFANATENKSRVFLLASKLIDKLILNRDYLTISVLLSNTNIDFDFTCRDVDRFLFFKGYACEMMGDIDNAIRFYEKVTFCVPSGYYDYLASRRMSELSSGKGIRNYYDRFVSPLTSDNDKLGFAKILFNFDKQNSDTYKSFVLYKIKDTNPFLMSIPYEIANSMDTVEKSKIKSLLERIKDEYVVVSKLVRRKMVYKGFSNVFSYVVVMRNRLEMKITRGIYNEGNNITANKFIDAYSKFLPFSIQEVLYPIPYVSDVIYSAEKFGVDPNLIYAVMKQESFFQEGAYSRAGAIGLMQVLYSTGKLVARKLELPEVMISSRNDLFKTDLNILLGTAYLAMLIESYGDLNRAISVYNGGTRVLSRTMRKYRISPEDSIIFSEFLAFRETRQYIKRVVKYYNVYSSIYNFDTVRKELNIETEQDLRELRSRLEMLQERLKPSEGEVEVEEDVEEEREGGSVVGY